MHVQQVRCADIQVDPRSPGYRDEDVAPLAESVRVFGVLRPIVLKAGRDGFVIVHGERRWRAARLVGLETIPATVIEVLRINKAALHANDEHAAVDPV